MVGCVVEVQGMIGEDAVRPWMMMMMTQNYHYHQAIRVCV